MSFPRYLEYKDSGVEWLGEVPKHWDSMPFKWVIERNDGGAWGDDPTGENDTVVLRSTDQTVDGQWKIMDPATRALSEKERLQTLLTEGDLVVTKSSGSSLHIGKTTLVTPEVASLGCCFGNFMQRLRMRPTYLPRLAWYLMNSDLARLQLDLLSNSTTGLANLNGTLIGEMQIALPPRAEQPAIINFLDHETAKIDALIQEQQRLIELLKEKRQAVISHAVTKGLNPSVPMKDSGVEWLGEAPEHWEVTCLKRYWTVTDCKHITAEFVDEGIPLASIREVQEWNVNLSSAKKTTEYFYHLLVEGGRAPLVGDLIFSRNATVGEVAQVAGGHPRFAMGQDVCLLRKIVPYHSTDYFQFFLWSPLTVIQLENLMVGSTFKRVNVEDIRGLVVTVPPPSEQSELAEYLMSKISSFNSLITEAAEAMSLLRERRSTLISAAVTGKIDVRSWKPPADENAFNEEVRQAGLEAVS